MFTRIEKLYIQKKNIDVKKINDLEERIKLSKLAYEWAFEKRKYYIGNMENKDDFIKYLEETAD